MQPLLSNEQKIALAEQLKAFKLTDLYQHLIQPIQDELDGLKAAYDCGTVKEIATLKGHRKGLDKVFVVMATIETEAETAKDELERQALRELRNHPPEDSSQL